MIAGAVVFQGARSLLECSSSTIILESPPPPPPPIANRNRMPRVTLSGPDGTTVSLPTGSRVIVNVWLQGCLDCMPAFEAMRSLKEHGGLGIRARVINVAYGEVDPSWAARYGVRDNLVSDPNGASLVKPLAIATFTTFVVDGDGVIIHRDRPDQAGFADRLRGLADGVDSPGTTTFVRGELTSEEVEQVARTHRTSIRDVCWDRSKSERDTPSSAPSTPPKPPTTPTVRVTASIIVGANGDVVSASAAGTDALVASCVENQVRTWKFPAHGDRSATVQIPFVFARE